MTSGLSLLGRFYFARAVVVALLRILSVCLVSASVVIALASVSIAFQTLGKPGEEIRRVLESRATWHALGNSSLIALGGLCVAWTTAEVVRRSSALAVPALALFLSFDPISRALAFRDAVMANVWPASDILTIISPAIAAGLQYSVVPLLASLGRAESPRWTSDLPPPARWFFVDLPPVLRELPAPGALVFLLVLFDVGVVQAASGNRLLLWSPLLSERAVQSNSLSAGATMIVIGLAATLVCYAFLVGLAASILAIIRRVSPRGWRLQIAGSMAGYLATILVTVLAGVPLVSTLVRASMYGVAADDVAAAIDISLRTGLAAWVLAVIAVGLAMWTTIGSLDQPSHLQRLFRASVVPALAPEQAFVLVGVLLIATRALPPGLGAVMLLQFSFTLPVAVFLGVSVFRSQLPRGAGPFARAFRKHDLSMLTWAAVAFRRELCLVLAICVWLVADDYLVAYYMNAPGTPLLAPEVFQSTRRDVSPEDTVLILIGAVSRLLVIFAPMIVVYRQLSWNSRTPTIAEGR